MGDNSEMDGSQRERIRELYERYAPMIHRKCRGYLKDEARAQDATQDVFIKLIKHLHTIREDQSILFWLYRTCTNHCISQLRKSKFEHPFTDRERDTLGDDTAEKQLEHRDLVRKVLKPWDKKTRQIVLYVYVDHYTQDEISSITGMAPSTIRKYLTRFRKKTEDSIPHLLGESHGMQ